MRLQGGAELTLRVDAPRPLLGMGVGLMGGRLMVW